MKNNRIHIAVVLLVCCTAQLAVRAQDRKWSVQECIDHAVKHNITIAQKEIEVSQGEVNLNTSRSSRLPGVSASASENISFGRGITSDNTYANTNVTTTSFSLGAEVRLFSGFRINNTILRDKLNLSAVTEGLNQVKNDVKVAVAQAYVQILFKKEIVKVARHQVEIDSLQLDRLEYMLDYGKAGQAEVAQQRASLEQSRSTLVSAESDLSLALLDLSQLLELESPEGFDVREVSVASSGAALMTPEEIYASAVANRPEVKSGLLLVDAYKANVKIAKADFYPTLSLSGGIGTNYYTSSSNKNPGSFASQAKNNFSQYIGVNLNIPIFSRMAVHNNVRSARLYLANQELQLAGVKKTLYKEIQQAYYNAVSVLQKCESSETALWAARDAFELMQAKYENGKANITEFNEAKGAYMKAEADLAQSRYESLYQHCLLDFYSSGEIMF